MPKRSKNPQNNELFDSLWGSERFANIAGGIADIVFIVLAIVFICCGVTWLFRVWSLI